MFDGASKHTIQKMSTPDMEELIEILAKEISARKVAEEGFAPMEAEMAHDSWVDNEQKVDEGNYEYLPKVPQHIIDENESDLSIVLSADLHVEFKNGIITARRQVNGDFESYYKNIRRTAGPTGEKKQWLI